jgi:hypothetical protein
MPQIPYSPIALYLVSPSQKHRAYQRTQEAIRGLSLFTPKSKLRNQFPWRWTTTCQIRMKVAMKTQRQPSVMMRRISIAKVRLAAGVVWFGSPRGLLHRSSLPTVFLSYHIPFS